MGFKIVSPNPRVRILPISANGTTGTTLYVGQLVKMYLGGIYPKGQASGAYDTSGRTAPVLGVVSGICEKNPSFSSTYSAEYTTVPSSVAQSHIEARQDVVAFLDNEWPKGDHAYYAVVELIDKDTVVEGPFFNGSFGTVISEITVQSGGGSTTGLGCTTDAIAASAAIAGNATIYGRSGANKGVARIPDSTSQTVHTWDMPMKNDISVGDTFVWVNLPLHGPAKMQVDSLGLFIDIAADMSSDYYGVWVERLFLETSGQEKAHFRFLSLDLA